MPTYQEIRVYKCYSDLWKRSKERIIFKILPSATIVSVKYSLTAKAIGIFEAFLDISYANSTFSSTLAQSSSNCNNF